MKDSDPLVGLDDEQKVRPLRAREFLRAKGDGFDGMWTAANFAV